LAIIAGVFSDIGYPAHQAMVADLLQGEQRTEGFSLLRIVANLAITFGPAIGGAGWRLLFAALLLTRLPARLPH
jgi:predicted MFS family arabinose efflux permease